VFSHEAFSVTRRNGLNLLSQSTRPQTHLWHMWGRIMLCERAFAFKITLLFQHHYLVLSS
jgi:hypothetical protein